VRHRGYDFTKEDLKYAVVALSNMSLSEAELARVSGGFAALDSDFLRELFVLLEIA
jgi:hypothetical protein